MSIAPELIRRGRELVKRESQLQFILGDLVLEVAPVDAPLPQRERALDGIADALQMSPGTLRRYRRVAAAWPHDKRSKGASWSMHSILASHPRRFDLIGHPPARGPKWWTCEAAQIAMSAQAAEGESPGATQV